MNKFNEVYNQLNERKDYYRLDPKVSSDIRWKHRNTFDDIFKAVERGEDFDLDRMKRYIKDLQDVSKKAKKGSLTEKTVSVPGPVKDVSLTKDPKKMSDLELVDSFMIVAVDWGSKQDPKKIKQITVFKEELLRRLK